MKISLNWIKEYVDIPDDIDAKSLAERITLSTVEVEGVISQSTQYDKMVVGEIKELLKHPNADKLTLCQTDIGADELKQVVCGGSNLRVGMQVVVAPPGAKVLWHGEGEPVVLKEAKLRGEKSFGMICGANEVFLEDLFPLEDEAQIVDLGDGRYPPGTPIAEALGFDDIVLEIDNKSLTNRPDLWGHYGMAREIAAIFNLELKPLPSFELETLSPSQLDVKIEDTAKCYRYCGALVQGVTESESPDWMKKRLLAVGQRPISLLVDLTNYVMFAVGQPLHAFDFERFGSTTVEVRTAQEKEKITLLDGKELELDSESLLITNGHSPVALAGIMGAQNSGIEGQTKTLLLETASFNPENVRRTATAYTLRTESSVRFEKGIDTERAIVARDLTLQLLQKIDPGTKIIGATDLHSVPTKALEIGITESKICSKIGDAISSENIIGALKRLGFSVEGDLGSLKVRVPSWRATGDVSIPEDIVEEVARIIGYDNLTFKPIPVSLEKAVLQPWYKLERELREYFAGACGLHEVMSYPWMSQAIASVTGHADLPTARLADAPSPDQAMIQNSLIPNTIGIVQQNIKHFSEFGTFEIARVVQADSVSTLSRGEEQLPAQPKMICLAVVRKDAQVAYRAAKGMLEGLFDSVQVRPAQLTNEVSHHSWAEPGTDLGAFYLGKNKEKEQVAHLALLSTQARHKLDLKDINAAIIEIELSKLVAYTSLQHTYTQVNPFPEVRYELAVVCDKATAWSEVEQVVRKSGKLIKGVDFKDEYTGKQIAEGKKSIAFQMLLADSSKTLTSEEAQKVADKVLKNLAREVGGELRQ